MARAIWKGVLLIGEERVPVKLYAAVESRGVSFRLLHEKDLAPVAQRMVHPDTGDVIPSDEVRKGREVEPGVFVVLEDDDLEEARPEPSRDIELLRFVPPDRLDGRWLERPYWLGPDEDDEAYSACVRALRKKERVGVARWVMRNREYLGVLRERDGHLLLQTLHHAGEVVDEAALPAPAGRKLGEREVAMAEQLVSALEGSFDPTEFQDEYRERVEELVALKAQGREPKLEAPPKAAPKEVSLEEALKKSLEGARGSGRARGGKERRSA